MMDRLVYPSKQFTVNKMDTLRSTWPPQRRTIRLTKWPHTREDLQSTNFISGSWFRLQISKSPSLCRFGTLKMHSDCVAQNPIELRMQRTQNEVWGGSKSSTAPSNPIAPSRLKPAREGRTLRDHDPTRDACPNAVGSTQIKMQLRIIDGPFIFGVFWSST